MGSIKQLVYSCITCAGIKGGPVGVCYACFVSCHTNHQVHELFYRRSFTCDCGTDRSSIGCSLSGSTSEVRASSLENKYNDNFSGINCYCKLYHEDGKETREMIQCIICEDWFHDDCIGPEEESHVDADDFLCQGCINQYCSLLRPYVAINFQPILSAPSSSGCTKPNEVRDFFGSSNSTKGSYLVPKWRDSICHCHSCTEAFQSSNLNYFITPEVTTNPPIDSNLEKSSLDAGFQALNRMERTTALNAVASYQEMQSDLISYLRKFAAEQKVVGSEDIQNFFEEHKKKKRRI
jgi:E3 ubiquitin-protein ligase UBR7